MNDREGGVEAENCARCGRLLPVVESADLANGEALVEVASLRESIQERFPGGGYLCRDCVDWLTEDEEEEDDEEANS